MDSRPVTWREGGRLATGIGAAPAAASVADAEGSASAPPSRTMIPSEPVANGPGPAPVSPVGQGPRLAGGNGPWAGVHQHGAPEAGSANARAGSVPAPVTPRGLEGNSPVEGAVPLGRSGYTPPPTRTQLSHSGRSTPVLQQPHSNLSPIAIASVRGQINESMVNLVRREVEQSEGRLKAEVARLRETVALSLEKMDRVRETALHRLEQKIVNHETAQVKLDKTVSALSGSVQGLSGVVQEQIQRAHGVDSRIWEMRHQLEEAFTKRCSELDAQTKESTAKWRAEKGNLDETLHTIAQNLRRHEEQLHELCSGAENHAHGFATIHERMSQMEDANEQALQAAREAHQAHQAKAAQHAQELAAVAASQSEEGDARFWHLEQQMQDMAQRLDQMTFEAHSDKGWEATLKEHEVRMNNLRSKLEGVEEQYQGIDDRVRLRTDMDARVTQLQRSLQELSNRSYDDTARVDAVASRLEGLEQSLENLPLDPGNAQMPYLQATLESLTGAYGFNLAPQPAQQQFYPTPQGGAEPHFGGNTGHGQAGDANARRDELVMSIRERIQSLQDSTSAPGEAAQVSARSGEGQSDTPSMADEERYAGDLEEKLNLLIAQLKEVVPKVVEHENLLRNFNPDTLTGSAAAADSGALRVAEAAERAAEEAKAIAQDALSELESLRTSPSGWKTPPAPTTPTQPAAPAAAITQELQNTMVADCSRKVLDALMNPQSELQRLLQKVMDFVQAKAAAPAPSPRPVVEDGPTPLAKVDWTSLPEGLKIDLAKLCKDEAAKEVLQAVSAPNGELQNLLQKASDTLKGMEKKAAAMASLDAGIAETTRKRTSSMGMGEGLAKVESDVKVQLQAQQTSLQKLHQVVADLIEQLGDVRNAVGSVANGSARDGPSQVELDLQQQLQTQQIALTKLAEVVTQIPGRLEELRSLVEALASEPVGDNQDYPKEVFVSQLMSAKADLAAVAAAAGVVEPPQSQGSAGSAVPNGPMLRGELGNGGHEPFDSELSQTLSQVEESESVVASLQMKLNDRIKKMDRLLDAVAKDVCRPVHVTGGTAPATSLADRLEATNPMLAAPNASTTHFGSDTF
mmetsp:Transcript_70961/g.148443  ORF Transcript_70961/g.148443 Transcript_70961/m.148443 type:complete len:1085 (+) Transcript_70961:93-3347(+)